MRDRKGNIIIQKYNEKDDFHTKLMKALHTLNPDIRVNVHIEGFAAQNNLTNRIDWLEETPIPQETIDAEIARLQAECDALAYARKRATEYPATKDFMEAYTEKEIGGDSTKWDAYVINYNEVRTENPK